MNTKDFVSKLSPLILVVTMACSSVNTYSSLSFERNVSYYTTIGSVMIEWEVGVKRSGDWRTKTVYDGVKKQLLY